MKLAIVAAAFALAIPGLASAAPQTWKIDADVAGFQYQLTCNLEVDGGKLDGTCTSPADPTPLKATGTYTDTTSEFDYDTEFAGQQLHVVYKGEMQADGTVKGTVDASGNAGTFTAKQ